jgi:hypothetical protein
MTFSEYGVTGFIISDHYFMELYVILSSNSYSKRDFLTVLKRLNKTLDAWSQVMKL